MKHRGILSFIFCIAMCSSIDVTLKLTSLSLNAIQLCFWRFFCGGLFCLPIALAALRREGLRLKPRQLVPFLLSGLLMVVLSTVLYQIALSIGRASVVSVLYSCSPIFVAIAAYFLLGERISGDVIISSVLYLMAIVILLLGDAGTTSLLSCILILLSSLMLAVYNVLGQRWQKSYPPAVYVSFTFLMGALELLALIGVSNLPAVARLTEAFGLSVLSAVPLFENISGGLIPVLLYIGIVATGMNFFAMQVATKELSAITTSLIFYFKLIIAPVLAWLVLGEQINVSMLAAILFVMLALLVKPLLAGIRKRRDAGLPQ